MIISPPPPPSHDADNAYVHKRVFKYVYLQETAEVEDSKTSTRGEGNEGRKWMNGRDGVGRFFFF